jgi:hypothetical protein
MAATASTCAHHPDRPGHALCMECRKIVCAECATDWDGVNYCASCLSRRRAAPRTGGHLVRLVMLSAACALLLAALPSLMVWVGVLVAGLR